MGYETELDNIAEAGRKARVVGTPADACPFSFINSPYWDTKDYTGFNTNTRPKMTAWMRGWIEQDKRLKR